MLEGFERFRNKRIYISDRILDLKPELSRKDVKEKYLCILDDFYKVNIRI